MEEPEEVVGDEGNFLINMQRGRVVQGIVRMNYQILQQRSMIFHALSRAQGPEVNAPIRIAAARNLYGLLWPDLPIPHRNTFAK